MCWLFKGWVSQKQIVLGLQILHFLLWTPAKVVVKQSGFNNREGKGQIMVWGAGPLPCAAGIFCQRDDVFSQGGLSEPPWESWSGGEAGEDGLLKSWKLHCLKSCARHPSVFVSKGWCFVRGAGTCTQECFHCCSPLLCSPSRYLDGLRHRACLNSLYYLIIQQVPKCLVSLSVWSASLTALPGISVTGLTSHQACALPLVTNAQCIFVIDYCSLLTQARKEPKERKRTQWGGDFYLDLVEYKWGLKVFNCLLAVEANWGQLVGLSLKKSLRLNPLGCPGQEQTQVISAGSDHAAGAWAGTGTAELS